MASYDVVGTSNSHSGPDRLQHDAGFLQMIVHQKSFDTGHGYAISWIMEATHLYNTFPKIPTPTMSKLHHAQRLQKMHDLSSRTPAQSSLIQDLCFQ